MAAIRTTGNVFCYEAISELNIKTKNFKDLLNSEPFTRKDIVVLQDPQDTSKNNLNSFHHLKNNFKVRIHFLPAAKRHGHAELFRSCCCCAWQDVWLKKRELLLFWTLELIIGIL